MNTGRNPYNLFRVNFNKTQVDITKQINLVLRAKNYCVSKDQLTHFQIPFNQNSSFILPPNYLAPSYSVHLVDNSGCTGDDAVPAVHSSRDAD